LVDGITTNPSLVSKEGWEFKDLLLEVCQIVDDPISAEVVSVEAEAMVKEGRELAKIHQNIVVKVPLIPEGLKATRQMASEGIRVNVTLCFSATQALLAAMMPGAFHPLSAVWMISVRTAWNSLNKS
jgi:transaldolase